MITTYFSLFSFLFLKDNYLITNSHLFFLPKCKLSITILNPTAGIKDVLKNNDCMILLTLKHTYMKQHSSRNKCLL